jgi:hypothetical protein
MSAVEPETRLYDYDLDIEDALEHVSLWDEDAYEWSPR